MTHRLGSRPALVARGSPDRRPWSPWLTATLGLLTLVCVAATSVLWIQHQVEQRLNLRALQALAANDINVDNLRLHWNYRDLLVTGTVPSGVAVSTLEEVFRATDNGGIRRLSINVTEQLAEQNPLQSGTVDIAVTLAGERITMTGTVLTESQRLHLYESAVSVVGMGRVDNRLKVSGLAESIPGADGRVASLANSLATLDRTAEAEALLSANDMRFNATVDDENDADDLLRRRLGAGDVGLVISGDIITRKSDPQGQFGIRLTYDSGRVVLSGIVPSQRHHRLLHDAAAQIVDRERINDELTVAGSDEPVAEVEQHIELMAAAMAQLSAVDNAVIELDRRLFSIDSTVEFAEDAETLRALSLRARALGLSTGGQIKARQLSLRNEVDLLQSDISSIEAELRENVVFQSGATTLDFAAKQTLDKIVDAMHRYRRPVLEIRGHTDDTGAEEANQLLSLDRAMAVRDYLELSGILPERVRALGLGESSQIASNQTEVGKKMNRRVEFVVRSGFGD